MTARIRHFVFALLTLAVSLLGAGAASANVGQALAKLDELARIEGDLRAIEHELNAFPVRDFYCLPPGNPTKASAQNDLQQILNRSNQLSGQASRARSLLVRLITNNQAARSAVDRKVDGGSGAIIDGSYFRNLTNQQQTNRSAHNTKLAALNAAPSRRCGPVAAPQRPQIAIVDPLVEVPTSIEFDPIPSPNVPDKFCHEDEKREQMDQLIAMRQKALANSSEAAALAGRLETLQREITANLAATRTKASQAAHDNDNFALKAHIDQIRKYEASLRTLADAIARARRQEREWMDAESRLDGVYKRVREVPVVDCTDADLTPANALPGTQFSGVGAALDLRPVEIPAIPDKVCTEEEKQEIIAKSFTALQNAWHNRDAWNARIEELNKLLEKAPAEQRQQLINARDEARREAAKWIRIVKDATDANNKALALSVDDCNGLTETGKAATAFPGVHAGVPEADTLPYDLPNVPDYVCTWDEQQALVKRAEAARAAASHNHRQWSARANALGDLLYGENRVSSGRSKLLSAHAEARAQSDHWATQMLDTAPSVYWKARNLEIRDCDKNKKTSMSTGGAVDLNDRLQRARDGQPVYNGGERQGGYGAYGRHGRNLAGDQGFDGSEAEDALEHALDGVRKDHVRKHDNDNRDADKAGSSHPSENWKASAPTLPAFEEESQTSAHPNTEPEPQTAINSPNRETTPKTGSTTEHQPANSNSAPAEPTDTGAWSETETWESDQPGGVVAPPTLSPEKFDGVSLSPAPAAQNDHPTQLPPGHVVVAPQPTLDRRNITLSPGLENGGAEAAAPQSGQGEWRQVAPPVLVITPQGGSAYDYDGNHRYPALSPNSPADQDQPNEVDPNAAAALELGQTGQ